MKKNNSENYHAVLKALLRNDLNSFINKAFDTINPGISYMPNWHIALIGEYLNRVRKGQIKRLIINMPPRALKSVCVSVAWPAWLLGQDPTMRIMVASYSQMLSIKHSMDCRTIMEADWFKDAFPETILSKTHNQKAKFMTTQHGFRFATSVGGSATGEGGDILIIDDPHNPSHIHSQKMRAKTIDWFEQTFATRLNHRSGGAIVVVMQRLHEEDLCGHLTSTFPERWEVLKLPAIYSKPTTIELSYRNIDIAMGECLHKSRDDAESLLLLEREIGKYNFAAQYLQAPISSQSLLLEKKDIIFADIRLEEMEYYVQSWDTAIKISNTCDYSVCTTWGISGSHYYLVDMIRQRLDYPSLKEKARKLSKRWNPKIILIEDKASGQSIIQDLRADGVQNIIPQRPKLDKITRFAAVMPLFQEGRVILPSQVSWLNDFLQEVTLFPNSRHDDIVDSVSQFLGYMKELRRKVVRIRGV
jgi:predicted phage terminase large subunit-like protein